MIKACAQLGDMNNARNDKGIIKIDFINADQSVVLSSVKYNGSTMG